MKRGKLFKRNFLNSERSPGKPQKQFHTSSEGVEGHIQQLTSRYLPPSDPCPPRAQCLQQAGMFLSFVRDTRKRVSRNPIKGPRSAPELKDIEARHSCLIFYSFICYGEHFDFGISVRAAIGGDKIGAGIGSPKGRIVIWDLSREMLACIVNLSR